MMTTDLTVHDGDRAALAALMPAMDLQTALARYHATVGFVKTLMKEGVDYGTVPGTDKPTLFKPGAERLCSFFGLAPEFVIVEAVQDYDGSAHNGESMLSFWYKCKLYQNGRFVGEGEGSANSRESKYRWRWVRESDLPEGVDRSRLATRGGALSEFQFAIDKAETGGQYGKPAAYWQRFDEAIVSGRARKVTKTTKSGKTMDAWEIDDTLYRVPNDDVASQANTILKMAQKRALIAAVLIAVNASEFFTQDLEDLVGDVIIETPARVVAPDNATAAEVLPPAQQPATAQVPPPARQHANGEASKPPPKPAPQPGEHIGNAREDWEPDSWNAAIDDAKADDANAASRLMGLYAQVAQLPRGQRRINIVRALDLAFVETVIASATNLDRETLDTIRELLVNDVWHSTPGFQQALDIVDGLLALITDEVAA